MMRLAEVYLNLAEAILGNNASTSEQAACDAFNAVRKRAGMPSLTTITYSDIHYERRIGLALEGRVLVRSAAPFLLPATGSGELPQQPGA